ncbi:TIGR02680 family protein [Exiguobacterium antarcticum]|uniref:TIGR02680 family protein n=1 Tax=Exiguobacterium antarcticum TaxID=132920 RepID=UPI000551B03B|nr:TIGR02680 family protein [Exiguobacterium antarcticum]
MNRWQMNRAGLLNFWYYTEQIFDLSDGKMLLRGSNGSGKSVTMQSFLPILLDGKKSPDRLDPFGSRARKMEDYLLGEKEISNREERTGYLFLEYKRTDSEQYVTTGIGLQAKRGKPMKFWGFVITDNRRIGEDITLYKKSRQGEAEQKIPYSRIELERMIGEGGRVVQTQGEYMQLVNKHVFGFETMEAYEELIKLLIQLRSPKLSKDFRPTVIYEILEASLPALSDEDLRHLSDTIEHMDQTKQQLEQLSREKEALTRLSKGYDVYSERQLADMSQEYELAKGQSIEETEKQNLLLERIVHHEQQVTHATSEKSRFHLKKETLERQQQRLQAHKVWSLEAERKREQDKKQKLEQKIEQQEQKQERTRQKMQTFKKRLDEEQIMLRKTSSDIEDGLFHLEEEAEMASFQRHALNMADYERQEKAFDFMVWQNEVAAHISRLNDGVEHVRDFEEIKVRLQLKQKELAQEEQLFDQKKREHDDWQKTFDQELETYIADIHVWLQQHDSFSVDEKSIQYIERTLRNEYGTDTMENIRRHIRPAISNFQNQIRDEVADNKSRRDTLLQQLTVKENELQTWRQEIDPEPPLHPNTKQARESMHEQNIPVVPFYSVVDFKSGISDEIKCRIEAALGDSGMLDALITDIPVVHDRALKAHPHEMAYTLADYLKPVSNEHVAVGKIDEILRSILIDAGETMITEDGIYRIGMLTGHAVGIEYVRYIGREARKKYREKLMTDLRNEMDELSNERLLVEQEIERLLQQLQDSEEAWNDFPLDRELRTIQESIWETKKEMEGLKRQAERMNEVLKTLNERFSKLRHIVLEEARFYGIEATSQAFRTTLQHAYSYKDDLRELKQLQRQFLQMERTLEQIQLDLHETEQDLDEQTGELYQLEAEHEQVQELIQQIEQQLQQENAENIRQQIQDVQEQLRGVEKDLENITILATTHETQLVVDQKERLRQEPIQLFHQCLHQAWEEVLHELFHQAETDGRPEEMQFVEWTESLSARYGHRLNITRSKADELLSKTFYELQSDLMEYRMRDYTEERRLPEWMQESEENFRHEVETFKQKTTRRVITLDLRGQQVNPRLVKQTVEEEYTRQQRILNEDDRELYEEILFKSVGSKLRSRIRRAEKWTTQMNQIMENRNISSGITFSIKWKPRTAEAEDELDTKDLVAILKQDVRLMKDEDYERITTHFRSRINRAQRLMKEEGAGQTLLQILKEVLDYRKWFSFILYHERTNEPKTELTNNKFDKFSGGEKALAMYIPLFTACYSRYQEAADTAPYIISLDEAFAGVDENNIREMFEVVKQLDFDFIMNSQILWGDYDTIDHLSVYELLRPQNADYVGVLKYYWNGKQRVLMDE